MPLNTDPISFFGPGYSLASSEIKLSTISHAGGTIGTFTVVAGTDVITTSADHNLKVGDIVTVSSSTTLPAGLSAATPYYVLTIPSSDTLTVSLTSGGTVADITDTGTGTHTMVGQGILAEVTDAEAAASGGSSDWRKVVFGIVEMLYQKWNRTLSADRPAKLTIQRSSTTDEATGVITRYYTFTIKIDPIAVEVTGE
jgi:hypothetical protein